MLKNGSGEPKYKFPEPNPFVSEEEDGEVASVGYRYRKWNLNNGVVSTQSNYFLHHEYLMAPRTWVPSEISEPHLNENNFSSPVLYYL